MNVVKLSLKNVAYKPLHTVVSIVLLGLSVALLTASMALNTAFEKQLSSNLTEVDMVIGAKGSPLQLVLSSLLHIDVPTGNINYQEAQKVTKSALIKTAVPVSYGDNYKGYRILGTTSKFVDLYHLSIAQGQLFNKEGDVVLGYSVAQKLKLNLGDEIQSSHGLVADATETHDEHLHVVGILKPSGTVADQLVLTPLETIWHLHEHEIEVDASEKEVTAMLVTFKNPLGLLQLPRRINNTTNMQAALPKYETEKLFGFLGIGFTAIRMIGIAILLVSALSIFINTYRMVKDRAYELALLRTYGASRIQLFLVVVLEGIYTGILGMVFGFLLSRVGMQMLTNYTEENYKYTFNSWHFTPQEAYMILAVFVLIFITTLLAVVPIFKMNISKILADEK